MNGAQNIWEVISWYYGNSALPVFMLLLMAACVIGKKKRKYVTFVMVLAVILLNDVMYRFVAYLGEDNTYYRFLWIFPTSLALAWLLFYLWGKMESRGGKAVCVLVFAYTVFLYSGHSLDEWFSVPENIYQLPDDTVQMGDLIEEVADGERVVLYGEEELLYGIREYNANICSVTVGETGYLSHLISENDVNVSGRLMTAILVNADIDYVAVKKEYYAAQAALNGGGCVRVGETDNYYLYYAKQETLASDLNCLYNGTWNTDASIITIENVMLTGLAREQQFLFYGDGRLEEFERETGESVTLCDGTQPIYSKVYETFIVCAINNKDYGITEDVIEELYLEAENGKPMILMLSTPLAADDMENQLVRWLAAEGDCVKAVYANNASEEEKTMLTDTVFQYANTNGYGGSAMLIQVKREG